MKVFLTSNPAEVRHGYTNVDPSRGSLDGVVEAGEAAEVVALGLLDHFAPRLQHEVLRHWASRLAPGGTLTLSAGDVWETARHLTLGLLDEENAVRWLYGDEGNRRAVLFSERTAGEYLQSLGLELVTRRTDGLNYVITARRPS